MKKYNILSVVFALLVSTNLLTTNVYAAAAGCKFLVGTTWVGNVTLKSVWNPDIDPIETLPIKMEILSAHQYQAGWQYDLTGKINGVNASGTCNESNGIITWVNMLQGSNSILSRNLSLSPYPVSLNLPPQGGIVWLFNNIQYTNYEEATLVKQ
jgi:hypothetical protein